MDEDYKPSLLTKKVFEDRKLQLKKIKEEQSSDDGLIYLFIGVLLWFLLLAICSIGGR